jgi:hypothetical protein
MEAIEGSNSMMEGSAVDLLASHTVVQFRDSIFTLHKQRCCIFSHDDKTNFELESYENNVFFLG